MAPFLALLLAAATPSSLDALSTQVAEQLGAPAEGRRGLSLSLTAEPAPLASPMGASLAAALGRTGWAVTVLPPGGGEPAARTAGGDWLLSLTVGTAARGRDLVAVGEAVPLWSSFFLQARPGVRPAPPRLVSVRAAVDPAAELLLRPARRPSLERLAMRRLAHLPYRVLALAAGDAGEPRPALVVVSPEAIRLLDAAGAPLASRALDPGGWQPARLPAATAVVGDLGGGRIGVGRSGSAGGEVLARRGDRLDRVGSLALAPLASGAAGILFGAYSPGKGALQDLLALGVDPSVRPRSARDLAAVAAVPAIGGGAPLAFGALAPDGRLELLDARLGQVGLVAGVGAGFTLADLDGDGAAELVASAAVAAGPDRLRVLRLGPAAAGLGEAPAFESAPLDGAVLSGAAADLTGDGLDDAIFAAETAGGQGEIATDLWLVTADVREAP